MTARRLEPSHGRGTPEDARAPLSMLLSAWQDTGDEAALDSIVATIREDCLRMISHLLRRLGIRDPDATDDAFTLVLGHLRRLPGAASERGVSRFKVTTGAANGDQGTAFVRWLCRERAHDVARSCRRRSRHVLSLTDLGATERTNRDARTQNGGQGPAPGGMDEALLRAAVGRLDERQRTVVELLLAGKSQVVIAHVLGVSEGTVSRIRSRALEALRLALDAAGPER